MKKLIYFFFLLQLLVAATSEILSQEGGKAASKKIAVTFDDLPLVRMNSYSFAKTKEYVDRLVDNIKIQKVPAIGFVIEANLYTHGREDKRKISLLEEWLNAGLELGNHTFSHKSAHEVPIAEFEDDILKGEIITKKLLEERKKQIQFFRFPELQTGMDLETKLGIESFLKEHGYKIAPATIVSKEWLYAKAYAKAVDKHDEETMKKIGESYLDHLVKMLDQCEKQSEFLFHRNINHILVIHANELNADYFQKIGSLIRSKGYEFVSLDEALKDEAYKSEDSYQGRDGLSLLDRWAKTRGEDNLLFNGAPSVPDWIINEANQNY